MIKKILLPAGLLAIGVAMIALPVMPSHAEKAVTIPAPVIDVPTAKSMQTAILAGGCFWGLEAVFEHVKGVKSVTTGYAGGTAATANYTMVSTETTGHAEAVKIVYDPNKISYGTLLRIYFSVAHDPTQLNRQYPDTGPSYRSAIFPQTSQQKIAAQRYIAQLSKMNAFGKPITTKVESGSFYAAETYHQDFWKKNPNHPYIVRWDMPKVAAFENAFPKLAI